MNMFQLDIKLPLPFVFYYSSGFTLEILIIKRSSPFWKRIFLILNLAIGLCGNVDCDESKFNEHLLIRRSVNISTKSPRG